MKLPRVGAGSFLARICQRKPKSTHSKSIQNALTLPSSFATNHRRPKINQRRTCACGGKRAMAKTLTPHRPSVERLRLRAHKSHQRAQPFLTIRLTVFCHTFAYVMSLILSTYTHLTNAAALLIDARIAHRRASHRTKYLCACHCCPPPAPRLLSPFRSFHARAHFIRLRRANI